MQRNSYGASSNINESLNAAMTRKAPKLRYYSMMTASADFRLHVLLDKKKTCEGYTQKIAKAINLSPGEHHFRHVSRTEKVLCKRQLLMKTPAFKTRRLELKKNFELVYVIENKYIEGITYKSNCAFLLN
jgi:hypothetical protein